MACCSPLDAQLQQPLQVYETSNASPLGNGKKNWGCLANFKLSDTRNFGRIKHLFTDRKNGLYVVDNNGFLYAFSANDFKEKWKVKLDYEQVADFNVSPDGTSIAICYNYIKTATKQLEIRNCSNGQINLRLKQIPDCYGSYYLLDVVDNTTLYPFKTAYNPQGTKLAIWYQNHGFDEQKCIASHEEKLIIIDPTTGDILASKRQIPEEFTFGKCAGNYPFLFNQAGNQLLIANCRGEINSYDAQNLDLIANYSFIEQMNHIDLNLLKTKATKSTKMPFNSLQRQPDGTLIAGIGKKGQFYSIERDLKTIHYLGQLSKGTATSCIFSPEGSMVMINTQQLNLWDLDYTEALLCAETPQAHAAHTVCFHPQKRALIVGTKRTLKIVAPCPVSAVHISDTFTATGHFIQAETSFSVHGEGNIEWAYDDKIIYHKYAKNELISTQCLGHSQLFNSVQNIPFSSQLRIKTDIPGIYTIFGGTKTRWNKQQVIDHLEDWK